MASNFAGHLLAAVNAQGTVTAVFPHEYIKLESWSSTPNQREEIKAYRDDNTRDLYRVTASGTKSKFSFTTLDGLHLADKEEIQAFFEEATVDELQRKVHLKFWNDETNQYHTGYFYIPDVAYTISMIDGTDIIYKALEYTFVEY